MKNKILLSVFSASVQFYRKNKSRLNIWAVSFLIYFLLFGIDMFCWYEVWSQVKLGGYYHVCKNAISVALFLASPVLWMKGKILRIYPILIMFFLFPVIVAECYCRLHFQMLLSGSVIAIVLESSRAEMLNFVKGILSIEFLFFLIVSISILSVFALWVWKSAKKTKWNQCLLIAALLSMFPMLLPVAKTAYKGQHPVYSKGTPLGETLFVSFFRSCIYDVKSMREFAQRVHSPVFPSDASSLWKNKPAAGVIVIGESACRNYWSLYGYSRNTTPQLCRRKKDLIKFTDCIAAYSSTTTALKYLLTTCTIDTPEDWQYTLCQLYRHCGWKTGLITSTFHWGEWDTVGNLVWDDADYCFYLQEHNHGSESYDGDLLKYIQTFIVEPSNQPKLLFVHLQGSHFPYNLYPAAWKSPVKQSKQSKQSKQDLYDKSIAYTDELLGGILAILESQNMPSFFVYISDHGETPQTPGKNFRVAKDHDCWEIPFVLWFSEQYRKSSPELVKQIQKNAKLPIQADQLFSGLAALGGIQSKDFKEEKNIFSTSFIPRKSRFLPTANIPYSQIRQ